MAPQGEPSGGHHAGSVALHEVAARGFRSADAYERARPEYPRAAVDALVGGLSLGAATIVVDLGAGTGKLTRALLGTGARLVAVEPLAAMRAEMARTVPGVAVVSGMAEAIPLRARAAGAVVAAQAFHWFSGDEALGEIHRVLGPGGGLGLVWNELVWSVPWVAELGAILDPLTASVPRFRTGRWRERLDHSPLFSSLQGRRFSFARHLDRASVVDWVGTNSFVAVLPEEEQVGVLGRVDALVAAQPEPVEVPYETCVYWCRAQP